MNIRSIAVILSAIISNIAFATDIVVKPGPYAIEQALQQAREARRMEGAKDVTIRLQAGTYRLNQTVTVRPEDSGTRIIADGNAVVSGGVQIKGWKKQGKAYVADVPEFNGRPLEFRQLWINGRKAVRARDVSDFENMYRIRSIDKKNETAPPSPSINPRATFISCTPGHRRW